jgi:formylglycine-generating enzyme required for sulfatase activity
MKTLGAIMLLCLAPGVVSLAEVTGFYRVVGPEPVTIVAFTSDGYITWTNTPTNLVFTVQTTASLPGGSNWVDYVRVPASNAVTTLRLRDPNPPPGMALIPAGVFTMGNTLSGEGDVDEVPTNTVYVSAFYMDRYEVTKALWDEVHQWATNHGYNFSYAGSGLATTHPVQTVTWTDCVKWCNARSEKAGLMPAYYTNAGLTAVYRTGQVDVQNDWVNWNAGYRLPTEAEWEKAARGGLSGKRFPWGDTISHSLANYTASTYYPYDLSYPAGVHPAFSGNTSPAGYFSPNGYGLHDLAGNVWERCWDRHGFYPSGPQVDPRGPATGTKRSRRGGSCGAVSQGCRVTYRNSDDPFTHVQSRTGFRSVVSAGQ